MRCCIQKHFAWYLIYTKGSITVTALVLFHLFYSKYLLITRCYITQRRIIKHLCPPRANVFMERIFSLLCFIAIKIYMHFLFLFLFFLKSSLLHWAVQSARQGPLFFCSQLDRNKRINDYSLSSCSGQCPGVHLVPLSLSPATFSLLWFLLALRSKYIQSQSPLPLPLLSLVVLILHPNNC